MQKVYRTPGKNVASFFEVFTAGPIARRYDDPLLELMIGRMSGG